MISTSDVASESRKLAMEGEEHACSRQEPRYEHFGSGTSGSEQSNASPCSFPSVSPLFSAPRSPTYGFEGKSTRFKATKKQLRESTCGRKNRGGNLLFVDLLYWVKDLENIPFEQFTAFVEDVGLPSLCRLATWLGTKNIYTYSVLVGRPCAPPDTHLCDCAPPHFLSASLFIGLLIGF